MPRVLFVHHRPQPSGAVRSLALLIGALDTRWEAHVLIPAGAGATLLAEVGATVHTGPVPAFTHTWDVQYRGFRWLVLIRELLSVPGHARRLGRLLRELDPAIVHLNDSVMLASGRQAHRHGARVVWHLRSSLASGGRDRRSRLVARALDAWGNAWIAIDEDVARTFQLRHRVTIVPNAVVAEEVQPADLPVPAGRITIGYVGYLRRQKGWPQFVEAMRLLVEAGAPVHAVVVGGGVRSPRSFRAPRGHVLRLLGIPDEEHDIHARVTQLDLIDRFTFLPFVTRTGPIYRALDVVVFPNQGAGLGRPVLEAAAYGVPVVASGSRGGAGILRDGETGILIPKASPKALADALDALMADRELRQRLGAQAAAHARLFDPASTARAVEATYDAFSGDAAEELPARGSPRTGGV
jgi:glycosyltransferase involved in cell wall biosynthesis